MENGGIATGQVGVGCRVSGLGSFVYLDGPDGETLNFFSFLMTVLLCRNRVELTGRALYKRF